MTPDPDGDNTGPNYGAKFKEADHAAIPRRDLPFGVPAFLGDDSWVRRARWPERRLAPRARRRAHADLARTQGELMNDTYVLRGRVATMAKPGEHLDAAQVAISGGRISHVVKHGDQLPAAFAGAPVVDTKGTIYPGLIDLHNHFAYNIRPLWPLPKRYDNRGQWGTPRYSAEV